MRKPPIFLDKPIAGAIIRQTDRQTDRQHNLALSVFAALIFTPSGRGKGGDCHADTLPAAECGRGTFARGPVVGRPQPAVAALLPGPHRPPAPHAGWAARASLH